MTEYAAVAIVATEAKGSVAIGDTVLSGFANASGVYSGSINYEGAFGAGLAVEVRARDSGIIRSLLSFDDSAATYTDLTDEAHSSVGSPDVPIMQTDGALADAMYFASHEPFYGIKFDVTTAYVGTYIPSTEYWDGLAWQSFTAWEQNDALTSTGPRYLRWLPAAVSGWATTTVNSVGPYYWIRYKRSGFSSFTSRAVCRKLSIDKTKYRPFNQRNTITSSGLTVTASWVEDTVVGFGDK
jgi:hypothetical protein